MFLPDVVVHVCRLSIFICDLSGEKGIREKSQTRSNAFGNRLNAFAFFAIPLFIRKVYTYTVYVLSFQFRQDVFDSVQKF